MIEPVLAEDRPPWLDLDGKHRGPDGKGGFYFTLVLNGYPTVFHAVYMEGWDDNGRMMVNLSVDATQSEESTFWRCVECGKDPDVSGWRVDYWIRGGQVVGLCPAHIRPSDISLAFGPFTYSTTRDAPTANEPKGSPRWVHRRALALRRELDPPRSKAAVARTLGVSVNTIDKHLSGPCACEMPHEGG